MTKSQNNQIGYVSWLKVQHVKPVEFSEVNPLRGNRFAQ